MILDNAVQNTNNVPSINNVIKWGVIGCGGVTEHKSCPAYHRVTGFKLAAVTARRVEQARDYAQRHGIETVCTDAATLIEQVDAVYIATPPDSHLEYALQVAAAGKICCVEKPLAVNFQQAQQMVMAFEDAKLPLFVAYYRRSLPRFLQIKQWLEQQRIGTVRAINWQFCKPANGLDLSGTYNWRTDAQIAKGGYFDDLASHGLDLFAFLLGDIKTATGYGVNQQQLYSAYDTVTACWQHGNGVVGNGCWNFGASQRQDQVEILGNKGSIRFAVFMEQPIVLHVGDHVETLSIDNPDPIQLHHVEAMRDALLHQVPHVSTGASAQQANRIMDLILGVKHDL